MKKFLKILGIIVGIVVVVIIVFFIYFNSAYPKVDPPSTEKVEVTPAKIERGKYLANHVTVCMDCHSTRDWNKYAGPIIPGTEGKGGEKFDHDLGGVPGTIYSRNITPAGIGNYTDGELMRAITCGVTNDGRALFPLMPYMGYNHLTVDDLHSIVAYIHSLKSIENNIPDRELDFPMNLIVKTIPPKSYDPTPSVDKNNPAEYGKYLVTIAGCFDCHTQMEKGELIKGMEFAGGFEFKFPSGIVRSANITPDAETGIGSWSKEAFIQRFKSMDPDSNRVASVDPNKDFNTPMPWTMYAGMEKEDLAAIYNFLRTLPPVSHTVTKFTPNM